MAHIHQIRILYDEMFCIKYKLITSNYQAFIYINVYIYILIQISCLQKLNTTLIKKLFENKQSQLTMFKF